MTTPNVLIVDDNRSYREAFRRNLILQGYDVVEAEDSEDALERLSGGPIDVVVTDLAMRHPTEGLDLIRQARLLNPHLPIIMISAVGTFEEGAEASRLGARYVISKSKIDEEMENLFRAIDQANTEHQRSRELSRRIAEQRKIGETDPAAALNELRAIMLDSKAPESVKGEAFDAITELSPSDALQSSRQDADRVRAAGPGRDVFERVDRNLNDAIPGFPNLEPQTQEALKTAEFLYIHGEEIEQAVDFSRSVGFSYCFAVENEAKNRLRKRLVKFFGDPATPKMIHSLLEDNRRSLSLFFHQHLLRVQRGVSIEVTIDNVFQTFQRILEHGNKYKPDGLKALGIILLCFGRSYQFRKFQQSVTIDNPLGIKGLETEEEVVQYASLLTNLQHYRNPYIHPEISEMEKLSKIRETTFDCMNMTLKLV
ncbi:MAG TPA: response regulator [Candidatus Sumerlaeota bacterium]|nr:MAG: Response regulator MprA [candidate division BRC1 bacterium ADurb.BinA292]HOE96417.1 response regulator [Candidatus Sumerlaeota bacterium]